MSSTSIDEQMDFLEKHSPNLDKKVVESLVRIIVNNEAQYKTIMKSGSNGISLRMENLKTDTVMKLYEEVRKMVV
jgi:hypothetical protein